MTLRGANLRLLERIMRSLLRAWSLNGAPAEIVLRPLLPSQPRPPAESS